VIDGNSAPGPNSKALTALKMLDAQLAPYDTYASEISGRMLEDARTFYSASDCAYSEGGAARLLSRIRWNIQQLQGRRGGG